MNIEILASRHSGDLEGQLRPFSETETVQLTIEIASECASQPWAQHTAWMLVNQLSRLGGVIDRIGLICPPGIPLAGNICPIVDGGLDLRDTLVAGNAAIGGVPVILAARFAHTLYIGRNGAPVGATYVCGTGWSGGFSHTPIICPNGSSLPFGPYIAAALAASEVFKAARMRPTEYGSTASAFYSAWSHRTADYFFVDGPSDVPGLCVDYALAGVGAVGSTFVHTLWACPGISGHVLLADNDAAGVDGTNLGRYPLFGQASVGRHKANEAARLAAGCGIRWEPFGGGLETYRSLPQRVISAVDINRARRAIQLRYPGRIISAATQDLRAEVLRCGPPGSGACLACNNPPEPTATDGELIEQLRKASSRERAELLRAGGVAGSDATEWLTTGKCGVVSARLLPLLRQREQDSQAPRFAVGFTTVMAGTLLAAEALKDLLPHDTPLSPNVQRAVFQFKSPCSRSNGAKPWLRDPTCTLCRPDTDATQIWSRRFHFA